MSLFLYISFWMDFMIENFQHYFATFWVNCLIIDWLMFNVQQAIFQLYSGRWCIQHCLLTHHIEWRFCQRKRSTLFLNISFWVNCCIIEDVQHCLLTCQIEWTVYYHSEWWVLFVHIFKLIFIYTICKIAVFSL